MSTNGQLAVKKQWTTSTSGQVDANPNKMEETAGMEEQILLAKMNKDIDTTALTEIDMVAVLDGTEDFFKDTAKRVATHVLELYQNDFIC